MIVIIGGRIKRNSYCKATLWLQTTYKSSIESVYLIAFTGR